MEDRRGRRVTDYFYFVGGVIILGIGIFLLIFPEISYRVSGGGDSAAEMALGTVQRRTFIIPRWISGALTLVGIVVTLLPFRSMRRKRGGGGR